MTRHLALLFVWLGALTLTASGQDQTQLEHGRALVTRMCESCHAIGASGDSPHPYAPPFHRLQRLLEFESFVDRLREGVMVAHPDMPTFRFNRQEAAAVAAYLTSIQPGQR